MSGNIQEESLAGIQGTRRDWSRHFVRWPVDPSKTGGVRRQNVLVGQTRLCQLLQHLECSLCAEHQLLVSLRARPNYAPRAVIREEAGGTFRSATPRYNAIQVHRNIQQAEMKTCPAGTH
jgi:hypothetical protein